MKYIITSGPMETSIDSVRKIQNSSTGKLGAVIADKLGATNHDRVVYIHTKGAIKPRTNCKQILISNHAQLIDSLKAEITDDSVVVHAMAISDFDTQGTIARDELAKLIINNKSELETEDDVNRLINSNLVVKDKLSSSNDQVIFMKRSIKVIDEIKKINPNVKLIGFKLLSNVSQDELLSVASQIKQRANCDYVVANIKEEVSASKHHAYILGDNYLTEVDTKEEIAEKIIELMEEE